MHYGVCMIVWVSLLQILFMDTEKDTEKCSSLEVNESKRKYASEMKVHTHYDVPGTKGFENLDRQV